LWHDLAILFTYKYVLKCVFAILQGKFFNCLKEFSLYFAAYSSLYHFVGAVGFQVTT